MQERKKNEIQGEQQNKKKKKKKSFLFSTLPPTCPFFYMYMCAYVLPIYQSSISITSSTMASQLNLIYIKLISNKKKSRKKSQCHTGTFEILIEYDFLFLFICSIDMSKMYEQ
jgi:hypothetical protein